MKTLTVKREGTSTEFSYELSGRSYERLAGCVENLKLPAKKACIVTDSTVSELYLEEVKNVLSPLFETVPHLFSRLVKQAKIWIPSKICTRI